MCSWIVLMTWVTIHNVNRQNERKAIKSDVFKLSAQLNWINRKWWKTQCCLSLQKVNICSLSPPLILLFSLLLLGVTSVWWLSWITSDLLSTLGSILNSSFDFLHLIVQVVQLSGAPYQAGTVCFSTSCSTFCASVSRRRVSGRSATCWLTETASGSPPCTTPSRTTITW